MSFTDKARDSLDIDPSENRASFARRYAGLKRIGQTDLGSWTQQIVHDASLLDPQSPEYSLFRQTLQDLPAAMREATVALELTQFDVDLPRRAAISEKLAYAFHEFQDALVVLREKLPNHDGLLSDIDARQVTEQFIDDLLAGAKLFDTKKAKITGPGL